MNQYKTSTLEEEQLLLVVTSTFGNGDCPSNGQVRGWGSWSSGGRRVCDNQEKRSRGQEVRGPEEGIGSKCSGHSGSFLCHFPNGTQCLLVNGPGFIYVFRLFEEISFITLFRVCVHVCACAGGTACMWRNLQEAVSCYSWGRGNWTCPVACPKDVDSLPARVARV